MSWTESPVTRPVLRRLILHGPMKFVVTSSTYEQSRLTSLAHLAGRYEQTQRQKDVSVEKVIDGTGFESLAGVTTLFLPHLTVDKKGLLSCTARLAVVRTLQMCLASIYYACLVWDGNSSAWFSVSGRFKNRSRRTSTFAYKQCVRMGLLAQWRRGVVFGTVVCHVIWAGKFVIGDRPRTYGSPKRSESEQLRELVRKKWVIIKVE